jgi:hypothetical protein
MGYNSLSFRLPGISGAPHAVAATAADDQHLLGLNHDLGSFRLAPVDSLSPLAYCRRCCAVLHCAFSKQRPVSGTSSAKYCLDVFKKALKISQYFSRR